MTEKLDSTTATATATAVATIRVSFDGVHVHELTINRPAVSAYLHNIAPEKQEIAFIHALDVGVTELAARRERIRK